MSYNQKHRIFRGLYKRYFKKILLFSMRMLRNRVEAEDITQEVFLRAYNNLEKLYARGDLLKWLYTVAKNLSYNYIRDRRHKPNQFLNQRVTIGDTEKELQEMVPDDNSPSPDKAVEAKEIMEMIQDGLNRLSLNYRAAIELCCVRELSYKRAAIELNTSENIIAHDLMRARKKLSYIMDAYKY